MVRTRKNSADDGTGTNAIRRAIRKSAETNEPPTVGKPVVLDPAQEKADPETGGKTSNPER